LKYFSIRYTRPNFGIIKYQLKEGWHIFISTIAISLYTVSNSFFLGLLTNTVMVAYYASAEKIMNAIQGLLGPISQAFFPHLSRVVAEDKERGIKALQKALFLIAGIGLLISVILFLTAPLVVKLIYGAKYEIATTQALRVLAVLPFIICLSNVFGVQTMIPFGLSKPFSRILIISSCVNVLLLIMLIPRFTYIGTAVSVVITESLVTLMMLGYLHFNGIYIWSGKLIRSYVAK
jgi:PST family polysaccharide transporter